MKLLDTFKRANHFVNISKSLEEQNRQDELIGIELEELNQRVKRLSVQLEQLKKGFRHEN